MSIPSLSEGQIIKDRFKIQKLLSKDGGFGITYLALDLQFSYNQKCVVKQLRNFSSKTIMSQRLERESTALEKLAHPNGQIPKFRGRIVDGEQMYIGMEFIEGITLRQYIEINGIGEEDEIFGFLIEMLQLLNFIHKEQIIHRDIKPDNIIIRESDKKPVLIDFGIMKEISGNPAISTIIAHTPDYSPPEQRLGEATEVSDLFSLGRTAIHWITGMSPSAIAGKNNEDIKQKLNWTIYASNFDPEIIRIINKATELNHKDRYHSAMEMLSDLKALSLPSKSKISKKSVVLENDFSQIPKGGGKLPTTREKLLNPLTRFKFKYAILNGKGDLIETINKAKQQVFKLGDEIYLEMVLIPSGTFFIGSPKGENRIVVNETPQVEMAVSNFLLGKFSVTQAQWKAVALLPQIHRRLNPEPAYFRGSSLPVERVSWKDAVEFCLRLSNLTGKKFRLPSEAEWEYACRAKSLSPYFCGWSIDQRWANFFEVNNCQGTRIEQTTHYRNKFGLSDMLGNVWEWCQDDWRDNYRNSPDSGSSTIYKVRRGGSWQNSRKDCRCARRGRAPKHLRNNISGFRVAADL